MSMIRSAKLALIVLSVLAFQSVSHAETPAGNQGGRSMEIDRFLSESNTAGNLLYTRDYKRSNTTATNQSVEMPVDNKELQCLARNIYHEAKGESKEGKYAVGLVTINRKEDTRFPKSICGVVGQRTRSVCQFSWRCQKVKSPDLNSESWRESHRIAMVLLTLPAIYDGLKRKYGNTLYFHAVYARPAWSRTKQRVAQVGAHLFYRDRSR